MADLMINVSRKAINMFGDKSTNTFYEELKNHKFKTTKCKDCNKIFFPPREFCPNCLKENLKWVELSGSGRLYAFTQQERATRFMKPDVLGLVDLDEGFRILSKIKGKFEDLKIGLKVKISFIDVGENFVLHQFEILEE